MAFLVPKTEMANQWAKDNICYDDWQLSGNAIAIDHHYIDDIIQGMVNDGFEPTKDFEIF